MPLRKRAQLRFQHKPLVCIGIGVFYFREETNINITCRRYKMLTDFERVHRFLTDTYDKETLNSYLLPQYFEYAHVHSNFQHSMTHRNGLWEDDGDLVGIACFEMNLGECHLHTKKGYEFLLGDMLTWAEKELVLIQDEKAKLKVWITDKETNKQELLRRNGYTLLRTERVNVFPYEKPFVERTLPDGFTLINGEDVDYMKLHACFWKGFNHGDNPDDDIDCRIHSFNAPRCDLSLVTIAVAPDGEYACALGMWVDYQNKYAYLEPLATIPKYRRMGLATVCLTEAMKKTKALGAEYCFGGGREFYMCIEFETVCKREFWGKEW